MTAIKALLDGERQGLAIEPADVFRVEQETGLPFSLAMSQYHITEAVRRIIEHGNVSEGVKTALNEMAARNQELLLESVR